MRTSFELKTTASNMDEAIKNSTKILAKFLSVPEDSISDHVNVELKVQLPEEVKTLNDVELVTEAGVFLVSIYGSIKQGHVLPFGVK